MVLQLVRADMPPVKDETLDKFVRLIAETNLAALDKCLEYTKAPRGYYAALDSMTRLNDRMQRARAEVFKCFPR